MKAIYRTLTSYRLYPGAVLKLDTAAGQDKYCLFCYIGSREGGNTENSTFYSIVGT